MPAGTPRRPRVLYVTPLFGYPPRGGPRLRTYNTVRGLARCADVSLYVWQPPDLPDPVAARQHMRLFCQRVHWPDPLPAAPSGWRGAVSRAVGPARPLARAAYHRLAARRTAPPVSGGTPPFFDELLRWVAEDEIDVVWLGFGGISYPLLRLKERTGLPIVLETESVWSRFLLREIPFAPDPERRAALAAEGAAKEAEERWGAGIADVTTAVSEVDAAYFRDVGTPPERVMLLANTIDVDAYGDTNVDANEHDRTVAAVHAPAICFAGTLSRGTANVDAALWLLDEIMPRVWSRVPELRLYLVGRDPAPELRQRGHGRVAVVGEVASIVPYFRGCLATVVPLRWESGTRFKILEAFACRTPVVSTTLGAEGLDVVDGRHLLLADTAETFADAVVALAMRPELRASLVEPAYALVRERYDLSAAERQAWAVLRHLNLNQDSGFGPEPRRVVHH